MFGLGAAYAMFKGWALGGGQLGAAAPVLPIVVVPAAPTIGTPAVSSGQVSLPFTDGANGGAAITSHNVYEGPSAGALTLLGTITTGSPFVDTGLTNGTARFYAISAVNSAGEGAMSAVVSATPGTVTAGTAVTSLGAVRTDTGKHEPPCGRGDARLCGYSR